MSTLNLDSPFVSYTLSSQEEYEGKLLSETQKQVIHNSLFMAAMEKMNLAWTSDNMQIEAELQGRIRTLQGILISNEESVNYFNSLQNDTIDRSDIDNQLRQDYSNIFNNDGTSI